jgi:phage shock protein PspC (stress-responsive transcriptional regulator)
MKKNISINISGIIFHIEEDGYEILRKYLDSINRYFSSFEDNSEILADIESRIAELLLSKLSEGKQVVTAEDVNALMATMGSVNDFKAAEEQEVGGTTEQREQRQESGHSAQSAANRRLYRDNKRKILGGVCSGLAHYFNVDPVWPRLVFALLAFATYGGLVVAYIIMWIAIPASDSLEDDTTKKMYRDTDNRVIGGVASGIAAFLGIDSTIMRVLFIVFAFAGGLGLVIYIIMWIALPEARTITDKIQMQGERVTLSNIESSVKKGLSEKDGAEESVFARIILFPFRLLAALIDAIAKVLGPVFILIVDVFRIGIGLCITLTGAFLIFALVAAFAMLFGVMNIPVQSSWNDIYINGTDFPLEVMRHSFPSWTAVFAFIAAFIPALLLSLLGASIIARRIVFNSYVGWSMFVLFFVSAGVIAFTVPRIVYNFKEEGEFKVEKTFPIKGTPVFKINEVGLDDYKVADINIRGYDGKELKLVQRFEAQGHSRKEAGENAQMIEYNVTQSDSVLTFDSNVTFRKDALFRGQRLEMDLYIPVNAPFIMDEGMWRLIDNRWDGRYYPDRDDTQTWRVTENGLMECVTCYKKDNNGDYHSSSRVMNDEYGFRDFNSIDLQGAFDVTVEEGDYAIEVEGSDNERSRYNIYTSGETLVIDYDDDRSNFWKRKNFDDFRIEINIRMPELREVDASGGGKIRFRGFKEDEVKIKFSGAVEGNAGIDARNLIVEMTGACSLDIAGTGDYLEADITGACGLSAYGFQVKEAKVEAHGASTAKVYVTEKLEIEKGMASSVSHRGEPSIIREND